MILKYLDKNNLHHAYLIEGDRKKITQEILEFLKTLDIKIAGNPDFININLDTFKIDDARNLKSLAAEKSFSLAPKAFIVSVNNFLLEAQNSLLKMFEEPIENTYFFIVVPDVNVLLKTFISRFYFISERSNEINEKKEAEKFISMPINNRLDFIKNLLVEAEDEDGEIISLDSIRSKCLKFLDELEFTLSKRITNEKNSVESCLEHFLKVRKFLRMPGSSAKNLMESVALIIPEGIL